MDDLAKKAVKIGCAASRFLTPAEAQATMNYFKRRQDVNVVFDGGYEGAERVRAVFLNPDWGEYERKALFCVMQIHAAPQDSVGHRDILGAVMSLGVERAAIGDIIETPAALICLPELGVYIAENLTKAGNASISLTEMESELSAKAESYSTKTDTVASPRLDTIVSTAFGMSRGKAAEIIAAGRVNLNFEPCTKPSKEVGEGAVLSVRGLGRARLLEIGGMSKKGRTFIKVGVYR